MNLGQILFVIFIEKRIRDRFADLDVPTQNMVLMISESSDLEDLLSRVLSRAEEIFG
jgi:hypothetical protein